MGAFCGGNPAVSSQRWLAFYAGAMSALNTPRRLFALIVAAAVVLAIAGCASAPPERSTLPAPSPSISTALFTEPGDNPDVAPFTTPRLIHSPAPHLQPDTVPSHAATEMLLVVDVGTEGEVRNVMVARSSGVREFDRIALEAVQTWQLQPAQRAGAAVPVRIRLRVALAADQQG